MLQSAGTGYLGSLRCLRLSRVGVVCWLLWCSRAGQAGEAGLHPMPLCITFHGNSSRLGAQGHSSNLHGKPHLPQMLYTQN